MSPKLQNKLFKEFDQMFAERSLNIEQTAMCWGVECGDGWFTLLWEMCQELKPIVDDSFRFTQIKEKFGELRVYYRGGAKNLKDDDKIARIILETERKSTSICELCGKTSKIRHSKSGWLYNRCDTCWGIKKLIE